LIAGQGGFNGIRVPEHDRPEYQRAIESGLITVGKDWLLSIPEKNV